VDKFKVIHVNFFRITYANNYSNRLIFDKSYSKCKLNVYVLGGGHTAYAFHHIKFRNLVSLLENSLGTN